MIKERDITYFLLVLLGFFLLYIGSEFGRKQELDRVCSKLGTICYEVGLK